MESASKSDRNARKYNVLIEETHETNEKIVYSYSGAILNDQYILTAKGTPHRAEA